MSWFMVFSSLLACNGESKPDAVDTALLSEAEDSGTEVVEEDCETTIAESIPPTGASGWFYRDEISLTFSESNPSFAITVTDSSGAEIPVTTTWDDARFNITVLPESGTWSSSENYTVGLNLCGNNPEIEFSTSDYGSEMSINPEDLVGSTYFIDLSSAEYIEPPGVGTLLSIFLDMPLLFGVSTVNGDVIDFQASLGEINDTTGEFNLVGEKWSFAGADFSERPYFFANTDLLVIPYNGIEIPVHDFSISGTFAADGGYIGQANFSGLGDTSDIGRLQNFGNDPNAICDLIKAQVDIDCMECPDGSGTYCVRLTGIIDEAELIPGLDVNQ